MISPALVAFCRAAPDAGAAEALQVMDLSVLDWAACGLAGLGEPVAAIVLGQVREEAGRGEAQLLGGGRAPARAAALANGTVSHALDYDDTHFAHIGHPSVAVVPAALAVAERQSATVSAFRAACLIGAEASIRVGLWLGRAHYEAGFHQTATAGSFGACMAAARILALKDAQVGHALGLTASRAAGLRAQFGTMAKPYHAGQAAACGVEAALLAARGMTARPAALDGPQGFGRTHAGQGAAQALDGLGERWLFSDVRHKFHACCHGLHAMLEAIGALGDAGGAVEAVHIRAHPRWADVCDIAAPRDGLEAKFSFRQAAALALSGHSTARLDSFSDALVRDPVLADLRARISVGFDPALGETEAIVQAEGPAGVRTARHDLAAPQPLDQRRARVRAKADALIGAGRRAKIEAALAGEDISALAAALARPLDD